MKVALFISSQTPESGGSYTFESQIIDALLELHSHSKHTFFLYVSEQKIPEWTVGICLPIVSVYLSKLSKIKSIVWTALSACINKIQHPRTRFKIENWREKHLLDSLALHQIDVILSLTPNCPTVEYPSIATIWDLQHKLQSYFPEVSEAGEWDRREKFYTEMLSRAAFIITGTETGKAEIERFYQVPAARIKVIPFFTPQFALNPVPIERNIKTKFNLPERYLFYPAQFWPHKNHVGLLLALKYLKEKYNLELALVLVGANKGNEFYVREKVQELDLSKQVYFLNFVDRVDLISLYVNAFAMTFVTFFGPDNFPPLEAMALGCPVIASNVSGAQEQLGSAAILVDPKQPAEIALAIESLVKDDLLRQKTIENGLKRANRWTAKDYIQEIFATIDDFEAIRRCWK
ncbi:glycosyltransferase family 4 protein [Chamaesiphon minutus]|uniref:Glycosyltransferase n=1 Tax=Chamaesiphon minutus (strain ATCC 27169 / PCC 6605) TaxID=1173020 RepID=K9U964_CHAP6|nr:glycosyltransferase family 1 protein [Chamaesiphon minutus]AFY91642.1 glycosyltransferase [Chamaesiphon minutus PCC 6605]